MSEQENTEDKQQSFEYGKLRNPNASHTISQTQIIRELNLVDKLLARAEKAEAERDELKRKLSNSEDKKLDLVKPSRFDWERVRIDAAIAAMQGHIHHRGSYAHPEVCVWAVKHADALVAELKKEVAE